MGWREIGQTLVMPSGKPIGAFTTRGDGPLVVMANDTALVAKGRHALGL